MSSSLYWEVARPSRQELSGAMKRLLRERYGEPVDAVLSHGRDYDWLQGVAAAATGEVKADAERLCAQIDRRETVRVWEAYE